jgi:hypothetical protein
MPRSFPLFGAVSVAILAFETCALRPRASVVGPASSPKNGRVAGPQNVKWTPAFPTVIEHGRIRLVKLLVPSRVHEIGHHEAVDTKPIFLHWVGDFERIHAVADTLDAERDRGIDQHFRDFVRDSEGHRVLKRLRAGPWFLLRDFAVENAQKHFRERQAVMGHIVPAIVLGLPLSVYEYEGPATWPCLPTNLQMRGDAPHGAEVFIDEALRRSDECRQIETEGRPGGDDAADFWNHRRVEKSGGDESARTVTGHQRIGGAKCRTLSDEHRRAAGGPDGRTMFMSPVNRSD